MGKVRLRRETNVKKTKQKKNESCKLTPKLIVITAALGFSTTVSGLAEVTLVVDALTAEKAL